jgi:putative acetyltransferase
VEAASFRRLFKRDPGRAPGEYRRRFQLPDLPHVRALPSSDVEIDAATRADADGLAATFTSARRAAMPWLPRRHSEADDRRYIAEQVIGECDVLVVRRERRPVAFLALRDDMVEHLYVRPDAQRSGLGSALLEAAKIRRPTGLRLWVFQRNHAARAFYADRGFAEVELTDGAANEEREPDALLAWAGRSRGRHAEAR